MADKDRSKILREVQSGVGEVWKETKKLQELEGGCGHARLANRARGLQEGLQRGT